jgi:predicted O-methyltransferase YrrM
MNVALRLYPLYRDQGFSVVSGLNALHWNRRRWVPFTKFLRSGKSVTWHLGISLHEVNFLDSLATISPARSVLVIGNSYGWSAVALALANPDAKVTAIDPALSPDTLEGLKITNAIAKAAELALVAVRGAAPQDVASLVPEHLPAPPDLILIDALHNNEHVVIDFEAARKVASPDAVFLFHDVHDFNLYAAMDHVRATGLVVRRLMATPSGMVIAFPASREGSLAPVLAVYGPDEADLAVIEYESTWLQCAKRKSKTWRAWSRNIFPRLPIRH